MDLRTFTEPQQGASYEQLLAVARATERSGLGAFFRSDHYQRIGDNPPGSPLPGTDSWVTLAALARETQRVRLGTLVTAATFRWPGQLAIEIAQVDAMSGGRVEVGIGAGWHRPEHVSYGIPFPPTARERFDRLDEYLEIVTGLWSTPVGQSFSFTGRYYRLEDCPALPKPVQLPGPPVIVGGKGTRRTPSLAARHAAECNVPFPREQSEAEAVFDALALACEVINRDPGEVVRSVALRCCIGESEQQCRRRAEAMGMDMAELRKSQAGGTVEEVAERLLTYSALGATRVYLQLLDLTDLDQIALIGERLAPLVASI